MLKGKISKIALGLTVLGSSLLASEVNVYSHRHYDSDKQLFKMFEEKTGIHVNVVKAKASALIKRIESEGKKSPADVLITVDAGRLYQAKQKGLFQSINSEKLNEAIPAHLRDKDNQWYGLTKRARVALYRIGSGMEDKLTTYEDLADPKFKGQIMVRSSNNIYNQSLMAAMIAHHGEAYAVNWAKGVVANMAKKPKGNDRYQVKAVANGVGSVAIANTYYVGKMVNNKKKDQREAVKKVRIFFPTFKDGGTHMNVSGAGVVKYAPNKENAVKFIEFLASKDAQKVFAQANYEFPVIEGVRRSALVESWGGFIEDEISMNELGKNNAAAIRAFDKAGWK